LNRSKRKLRRITTDGHRFHGSGRERNFRKLRVTNMRDVEASVGKPARVVALVQQFTT
jgi:hypothetical protein